MVWLKNVLTACAMITGTIAVAEDKQPIKKPQGTIEVRKAESKPAIGLIEANISGTKRKVYLHKTASLSSTDFVEASWKMNSYKMPEVSIKLTKEGGAKLAKVTKEHLEKPLAILLNGKVISAPIVKDVIRGNVMLTGISKAQAERFVKIIQQD